MNLLRLSFILLLALNACSSPPKPIHVPTLPLPESNVQHHYLKPSDVKRVRTGEFVKTYHVGRSVKGRGGATMHEAHPVYRLEKPSRWNLARDQPPLASTGPVNRIVDSAFKPAPESKAIRTELNRQRELSGELAQARDELEGAATATRDKLSRSVIDITELHRARKEIEKLTTELEVLRRKQASVDPLAESVDEPAPNTLLDWGHNLEAP